MARKIHGRWYRQELWLFLLFPFGLKVFLENDMPVSCVKCFALLRVTVSYIFLYKISKNVRNSDLIPNYLFMRTMKLSWHLKKPFFHFLSFIESVIAIISWGRELSFNVQWVQNHISSLEWNSSSVFLLPSQFQVVGQILLQRVRILSNIVSMLRYNMHVGGLHLAAFPIFDLKYCITHFIDPAADDCQPFIIFLT